MTINKSDIPTQERQSIATRYATDVKVALLNDTDGNMNISDTTETLLTFEADYPTYSRFIINSSNIIITTINGEVSSEYPTVSFSFTGLTNDETANFTHIAFFYNSTTEDPRIFYLAPLQGSPIILTNEDNDFEYNLTLARRPVLELS